MLMQSAVAGAYSASFRVSLPTSASFIPSPPNSPGIAIRRYPAALSSSKSSWQKRFSRSYIGARSRHFSSNASLNLDWAVADMVLVLPEKNCYGRRRQNGQRLLDQQAVSPPQVRRVKLNSVKVFYTCEPCLSPSAVNLPSLE